MRIFRGKMALVRAEILGIFLGIKPSVVRDLIFNKNNPEAMMIAVISHCLEHDEDRSWCKLADAVELCDNKVLAEKIRKEHVEEVSHKFPNYMRVES